MSKEWMLQGALRITLNRTSMSDGLGCTSRSAAPYRTLPHRALAARCILPSPPDAAAAAAPAASLLVPPAGNYNPPACPSTSLPAPCAFRSATISGRFSSACHAARLAGCNATLKAAAQWMNAASDQLFSLGRFSVASASSLRAQLCPLQMGDQGPDQGAGTRPSCG
jgi:hypothetical protein